MGILLVVIFLFFMAFISIACVIVSSRKEMIEHEKVIDDYE